MNLIERAKELLAERLRTERAEGGKAFRERAWSEFERQGLPDRHNEAWKYSALTELSRKDWAPAAASDEIPAAAAELLRAWRDEFDVAVLINGVLHKKASRLTLESGYSLGSVAGDLKMDYDDGFVSMAAAVHRGGYHLHVEDGVAFPRPLLIVNCVQGEGAWASTLNHITLGARAEMQVCEVFVGGAAAYLRTDITQAELGEGAIFSWSRLQQDSPQASHFSEAQARLAKSAQLHLTQVNSGGAWGRHSLKVAIDGEHAEAQVNGLTFGRERQHLDQRVNVLHHAGHSTSSQLFKGVLKDHARGVLNGKIYIARHAQKVNSSQLNHNLLLSPQAEADTKPELEIYADDVKANHGASIGKLDEDKLFYLMSRAIPKDQAMGMLAKAFVGDVLMKIHKPTVRALVTAQIEALLPNFLREMEAAP